VPVLWDRVGVLAAPLLDHVGHLGDPLADDERQSGVLDAFTVGLGDHPGIGDHAAGQQARHLLVNLQLDATSPVGLEGSPPRGIQQKGLAGGGGDGAQ
jgi:hypothetical protein